MIWQNNLQKELSRTQTRFDVPEVAQDQAEFEVLRGVQMSLSEVVAAALVCLQGIDVVHGGESHLLEGTVLACESADAVLVEGAKFWFEQQGKHSHFEDYLVALRQENGTSVILTLRVHEDLEIRWGSDNWRKRDGNVRLFDTDEVPWVEQLWRYLNEGESCSTFPIDARIVLAAEAIRDDTLPPTYAPAVAGYRVALDPEAWAGCHLQGPRAIERLKKRWDWAANACK